MTYSFSDITLVVSHPSFGQYTAMGEGLGTIDISMANDNSQHDVSADGRVVTTKIKAGNGNVALTMQQTSSFNKWLTKLFNYLKTAKSSEWARTTITVRAPQLNETTVCTGVSFQKPGDKSYQAQSQMKIWNLMAEDIQHNTV